MRISTGQLAQLTVQTLKEAFGAGTAELKVGSVVRATLLDVLANSEALLQVGTQKVRVQLDAPLQPGDRVALLVTGEQKQGASELKVISVLPKDAGAAAAKLDANALLLALGLEDDQSNQALVQELLARNVPLKPAVVQAASQVLQGIAHPTAEQVATLGKMAELGIPIGAGTFEAMDALDNGPKLHESLAALASGLEELLPESGESQKASAAAAGQKAAGNAQVGENGEGGVKGNANDSTTTNASNVANPANAASGAKSPTSSNAASTVNTLSGDVTDSPSSTLEEATPQPAASSDATPADPFPRNKISRPFATTADNGRGAIPISEETKGHLESLAKTVRALLQEGDQSAETLHDKAKHLGLDMEDKLSTALRRLPAERSEAMLKQALEAALHGDKDGDAPALKQALLQVQGARTELQAAGQGALLDQVNTVLNQVTGQQVMQTAGQDRTDLMYQFAAVPVKVGASEQTVELHVMSRKGPGQKTIDPSNCYLLFRLDMPNLGSLDIHLHIVDRVVGLRFLSEEPQRVDFTSADQRELWDALQGVGFHLGAVKVEEKKPLVEGIKAPLLPPILTQGAFDLKA